MRRKRLIIGGTALALATVAGVWLVPVVTGAGADVARGARLYGEACASCHGDKLQGQPDWQTPGADGIYPAPPHDESGHTWHHSDAVLIDYIRLGGAQALAAQGVTGFASGMPAFGNLLSENDTRDILAFIKSNWPKRARAAQAARSAAP